MEYKKLVKKYRKALKEAKDKAAKYGVNHSEFKKAVKKMRDLDEKLTSIDSAVEIKTRQIGFYN